MKRAFSACCVIVLLLVASAQRPVKAKELETITISMGSSPLTDGFAAVIKLAEERIGVRVEIEHRGAGVGSETEIRTRLAAGRMADICKYNTGALFLRLNPAGYFVDLSGYDWIKRLDDTFTACVSENGAIYGVPLGCDRIGAVLYNRKLYAQYGLSVPETWAQFIDNCRVLKKAGKVAVIGTFGDSWTAQMPFLADHYNVQHQLPTFSGDFERGLLSYEDTPLALRSFEKMADLIEFYNGDCLTATAEAGRSMLESGEGAHWITLFSSLESLIQEDLQDIGMFAMPADKGPSGLTIWVPDGLYVNKNSKQMDAAIRFLEFCICDEALDAYIFAEGTSGLLCIRDYEIPESARTKVFDDMMAYMESGRTCLAMEFENHVKIGSCPYLCVEVSSGVITPLEAARLYDQEYFATLADPFWP